MKCGAGIGLKKIAFIKNTKYENDSKFKKIDLKAFLFYGILRELS